MAFIQQNETKRARYVPNLFRCRHKIRRGENLDTDARYEARQGEDMLLLHVHLRSSERCAECRTCVSVRRFELHDKIPSQDTQDTRPRPARLTTQRRTGHRQLSPGSAIKYINSFSFRGCRLCPSSLWQERDIRPSNTNKSGTSHKGGGCFGKCRGRSVLARGFYSMYLP